MSITEIIVSLSIALIYPLFFHKLTKKLTGYDIAGKLCSDMDFDRSNSKSMADYKNCSSNRDKVLGKADFRSHLIILAIAVLSIIISTKISQKSTKLGVGFGGIILIIIAVTAYWHNYNETSKIIVSGIALIVVMYVSVRLYSSKSITDIFSFE